MAKAFAKTAPEFITARVNARLTPEKMAAMYDAKTPVYVAKFIHAGMCGYAEQKDITYLSNDVLYRMAQSFVGRPVVLGHDLNITDENIQEKMRGVVTECWTDNGDDWYVKFAITDQKLAKKIDEDGFNFVSCAYIITAFGEPEIHDGIECTTVVNDAFYHHLAITNSPRYDNAQVYRVNENTDGQGLYKIGFSDIVKLNETTDTALKLNAVKEVEVEDEVLFETAAGHLTLTGMVEKINELTSAATHRANTLAAMENELKELNERITELNA